MRLNRSNGLIKRYPLPIYHRTVVSDPSSVWGGNGNETMDITTEVAINCTLQPVKPQQLTADLEGVNIEDIFVIRSDTPLFSAVEGTNFKGSGVYIPPSYFTIDGGFLPVGKGGFYNCIEAKHWNNGVIPHFKATIVKDQTVEEGFYPTQRVLETEDLMDSNTKLKSGIWKEVWLNGLS